MSFFICLIISLDSETSSIIFYSLRMTHFSCELSENSIRSRWVTEKVSHWWLITLWWFIKIAIFYRRERKKSKSEWKLKWRYSIRYSPWHRLDQIFPDMVVLRTFIADHYIRVHTTFVFHGAIFTRCNLLVRINFIFSLSDKILFGISASIASIFCCACKRLLITFTTIDTCFDISQSIIHVWYHSKINH